MFLIIYSKKTFNCMVSMIAIVLSLECGVQNLYGMDQLFDMNAKKEKEKEKKKEKRTVYKIFSSSGESMLKVGSDRSSTTAGSDHSSSLSSRSNESSPKKHNENDQPSKISPRVLKSDNPLKHTTQSLYVSDEQSNSSKKPFGTKSDGSSSPKSVTKKHHGKHNDESPVPNIFVNSDYSPPQPQLSSRSHSPEHKESHFPFHKKKKSDEEKLSDVWDDLSLAKKMKMLSLFDQEIRLLELKELPNEDRSTLLMWGCRYGDIDEIREVIAGDYCNVNRPDLNGVTPLIQAICDGNMAYIKILLCCEGIDLNQADGKGVTPLMHAGRQGDLAIFKILYDCPQVDVNMQDKIGNSLLHHLVMKKQAALIKMLIMRPEMNCALQNKQKQSFYAMMANNNAFDDELRQLCNARYNLDFTINDYMFVWPKLMRCHKEEILDAVINNIKIKVSDSRNSNGEYVGLPSFLDNDFIKLMIKIRRGKYTSYHFDEFLVNEDEFYQEMLKELNKEDKDTILCDTI